MRSIPGATPSLDNREMRKSVARLRSSSHRLNIETARYQTSKSKPKSDNKRGSQSKTSEASASKEWNRCCKVCCDNNGELLLQLPFAERPIIEDEHHVLVSCPRFHHLRLQLDEHIKSTLLAWDERLTSLFEEPAVHKFSSYIHKIFQLRLPKKQQKIHKANKDNS